LVIASWGLGFSFGLEAVLFGLSALSVLGISALPPGAEKATMGVKAIAEGLRYLRGQRRIMSTFAIDINAMLFGMPRALFPAIGTELFGGDASTVGLLYAAPGAGALIAAFTSGWVGTIKRRGRMIVGSVIVWGIAIALFGLVRSLPLALFFLAVAGAADVVSAVFRNTIVQLTVPNHLRGRISGIHVAVVRSGPRLGDLESGAVAAVTSEQVSVVSGGIACVLGALLVARLWPELLAGDEPPPFDPG
jgi:MFS family permease